MIRLCRRAWNLARARDFDELLRGFLDTVPAGLFHFDILHVTEVTQLARLAYFKSDVRVGRVGTEDIARLAEVFSGRGEHVFEERLAAGHIGLIGTLEGAVCGMAWVNLAREHVEREKFCTFVLPPDGAWSYDLAIPTEYRLTGAVPSLRRRIFEEARAAGRTGVFGYVRWHNKKWLKVLERLGHRRTQRITVINLLGLRIHRVRKLDGAQAPYTRIGFRSHPRVGIEPSEVG